MNKYFILFIFSGFLVGCTSAVKFAGRNTGSPSQPPKTISYKNIPPETSEAVAVYEGVASYYADKFHGRTTANGEKYDMYGLTAAHNSWPFNTRIRVTNLTNGKQCLIRVNDRMPLHPERIIDLSLGTAMELDMVQAGLAKVRLEILEWGEK
ncbi:MAG: hypothetical protein SCALA702_02780 [Melioribacteraceae bacterium]|nr:MAG: hypothetical protein SCALA702_02780 [Melioribacteraceae bacterium]